MLGFYEEIADRVLAVLDRSDGCHSQFGAVLGWENDEKQVILQNEAALELGGGNLPAVSMTLCLDGKAYGRKVLRPFDVPKECASPVLLYGDDLQALATSVAVKSPYARITFVEIKPEFLSEEFKLYQLIRSVEYVRYHVSPVGFMPRISTLRGREQVRVSSFAIASGLGFADVGGVYEDVYAGHPAVSRACTAFVTSETVDFKALGDISEDIEKNVMSLEHPLDNLNMDCNSCNLRQVCDEAEKLCR